MSLQDATEDAVVNEATAEIGLSGADIETVVCGEYEYVPHTTPEQDLLTFLDSNVMVSPVFG
jgi:hypothetical protein